jgi:hypothetical protein
MRRSQIKLDPAMKAVVYMCGEKTCNNRFLLGLRNVNQIKHADATIRSQGWLYHERRRAFLCPQHRHYARALDVERTVTGRALPSHETRIDCWVYREAWYRSLLCTNPLAPHSQPSLQPTHGHHAEAPASLHRHQNRI